MKITCYQGSLITILLAALLLTGCDNAPQEQSATENPPAESSGFSQAMQEGGVDLAADVPTGSAKAVTPYADLEVAKASGENAYTIAELFAAGAELNGKTVRVRGQVVKFSPAIMDRNFIHLQDGSGNPEKSTHDLVATSEETVELGETITVEGVLAADKDFGAGYTYQVILEESRVVE